MSQRFLKLHTSLSPIFHQYIFFVAEPTGPVWECSESFIRTTEEDVTHTDNKASQQGDAEGDGEGSGLNTALFSSRNISARHIGEDVFQTETHKTKNTWFRIRPVNIVFASWLWGLWGKLISVSAVICKHNTLLQSNPHTDEKCRNSGQTSADVYGLSAEKQSSYSLLNSLYMYLHVLLIITASLAVILIHKSTFWCDKLVPCLQTTFMDFFLSGFEFF